MDRKSDIIAKLGAKMRVLYDGQIFTIEKFGGISRYFYQLIENGKDLFEYDLSGALLVNQYIKLLKPKKYCPFKFNNMRKGYIKIKIIHLIDRLNGYDFKKKIDRGNYDILHPTFYNQDALSTKKRLVITIHDMIPEFYYKNSQATEEKKNLIFKADKVIAISTNTKNDIIKLYPEINSDKIAIIHHGVDKEIAIKENQKRENYILFVGGRQGYKNFDRFLDAVAPLLLKYDLRLICTGYGFGGGEMDKLRALNILDRSSCHFFTEEGLKELYSKALCFVFPSFYEGFGLPILEAFAAGAPTLLANCSSLPEVGGDGALYFDPYSVDDMRSAIEKVVTSVDLQNQLILKGREKLKEYSWEKCARETADVYKSLMS